ncbi:MAG TPA: sulfatase [Actinomycetota bacterium]|nr:sulfatase [Actinomycetota bacterium]
MAVRLTPLRIGGLVLVAVVVATGAVVAVSLGKSPFPRPNTKGPNVLVIVTDDQRWDSLSVMPKTRALIARHGIQFSNAVVTTPLCCPSRSSIYSGRYAHNHGVWDNNNTTYTKTSTGHLDTELTVQHVLHRAGYFTGHVDRYLNNWEDWTDHPPDFDQYAIGLPGHKAWDLDREALINGHRVHVHQYSTSWIRDMALLFLDRFHRTEASRPWLLFVTTRAPHLPAVPEAKYRVAPVPPFHPPPSFREQDLSDKPWLESAPKVTKAEVLKDRANQLRTLMSVDDMVGALFARLQQLGELDNTLVVFTSDNGELYGEHDLGAKRWPYDESLRVPLLVRFDAGHIPQGQVRTDVVANIDIAPTVYAVTGVRPPYTVDGHSLFSSVRRRQILVEYLHDVDVPEIPQYAGVWSPGPVFLDFPKVHREEYYAANDPYQLDNLDEERTGPDPGPYVALLAKWRTCAGSTCP